ncbi:MMPL family transporter [Nocardia tengchongensis]|uniref:MMPL family transporter n=1 Tax=Nocardia tengchongensis TaxID=2055889 RepID=UPI0036CC3E73
MNSMLKSDTMNSMLATGPGQTAGPVPQGINRPGRIGGWCYDHRRIVLAAWIIGLLALFGAASGLGPHFRDNFGGVGQAQQVQDILHEQFPSRSGDSARVVFHSPGPIDAATDRITEALNGIRPLPAVVSVSPPIRADDGHTAFATIQFDAVSADLAKPEVQRVIDTARSYAQPDLDVALGGQPISVAVKPKPGPSEAIGIGAAILIMLVAFGSVVAMGLPILVALVGVGVGYAVVALVSHLLTEPSFGPALMAMIGLGVGIDYALFIVTRYRQGLTDGLDPRAALLHAMATAGRAVLFAGTTVLISLCGLFLVGQQFLDGLAAGTILAVLTVLAATITLLPALLGFAGHTIDRWRVPGPLRSATTGAERGLWWQWSRVVQQRPVLCGSAALLALLVLAVPTFAMRLAFSDSGNDPAELTTRQAYDLLSDAYGPGFNGPLVLVAELPGAASDHAVLTAFEQRLATVPGIARAAATLYNASGDAAVLTVYPTSDPQSADTAALVERLRNSVVPQATTGTDVRILVGGQTAAGIDESAHLGTRLPWVIGLVILLSFVLLMAVFRSIAIPLKAAAMNLLSIGAAYGAIVAVYQWGWLSMIFGVTRTGPIDPWIPLMMFTITFGLSMDYEVFLLSRIQEEWRRRQDNSAAVAHGIAATGRIITAAAAIMVCVFGSFVIDDPLRTLNVFGLGLAVAILVDATVVRMILAPAIMQLLGRANWWLPRWLDRITPHLAIETDDAQFG